MNRDEDDTLDEALPAMSLNGSQHAFPPWPQRLLNEVFRLGEIVKGLARYVEKIQAPSQRNATATVAMLGGILLMLGYIAFELHRLVPR